MCSYSLSVFRREGERLMNSQEDREFNIGCGSFIAGLLIALIVSLIIGSCSAETVPEKTHPVTYSLHVSSEEVIVPSGYKLVSVSEGQFYCQEQDSEQNRIVECSPTDGTIGDRYNLPEGYILLGIRTNSVKDEEKIFYCMNLRTAKVTYCSVIVPAND